MGLSNAPSTVCEEKANKEFGEFAITAETVGDFQAYLRKELIAYMKQLDQRLDPNNIHVSLSEVKDQSALLEIYYDAGSNQISLCLEDLQCGLNNKKYPTLICWFYAVRAKMLFLKGLIFPDNALQAVVPDGDYKKLGMYPITTKRQQDWLHQNGSNGSTGSYQVDTYKDISDLHKVMRGMSKDYHIYPFVIGQGAEQWILHWELRHRTKKESVHAKKFEARDQIAHALIEHWRHNLIIDVTPPERNRKMAVVDSIEIEEDELARGHGPNISSLQNLVGSIPENDWWNENNKGGAFTSVHVQVICPQEFGPLQIVVYAPQSASHRFARNADGILTKERDLDRLKDQLTLICRHANAFPMHVAVDNDDQHEFEGIPQHRTNIQLECDENGNFTQDAILDLHAQLAQTKYLSEAIILRLHTPDYSAHGNDKNSGTTQCLSNIYCNIHYIPVDRNHISEQYEQTAFKLAEANLRMASAQENFNANFPSQITTRMRSVCEQSLTTHLVHPLNRLWIKHNRISTQELRENIGIERRDTQFVEFPEGKIEPDAFIAKILEIAEPLLREFPFVMLVKLRGGGNLYQLEGYDYARKS